MKPCRCGSNETRLLTWRMGNGASYWCPVCGAGTPADKSESWRDLIVNLDGCGTQDAEPAAREAWNKWASLPLDRPS